MIGPLLVSWPDRTCCLVCDTCAPLFCVFLSCYCSNVLCAVVTCVALTEGYHCLSGLISLLPVMICHCYICGTECRSESLTDSVWVCFAHTHTHTSVCSFVCQASASWLDTISLLPKQSITSKCQFETVSVAVKHTQASLTGEELETQRIDNHRYKKENVEKTLEETQTSKSPNI